MRLKADCLFDAGVIDAEERLVVYSRTGAELGLTQAGGMPAPAVGFNRAHQAALVQ